MYQYNSKLIEKDDIFICLPGGEPYIEEALARGAKQVLKIDRLEMADLVSKYYDEPSKKLTVIGVTGTNGKTTVTYLISQALTFAGFKPYVLGTINSRLTTPEALDIQRLMAEHVQNQGTHFVMEVSSHAIAQNRIANIKFALKILTNITQDHLDYHKTFENYRDTKLAFMRAGDCPKIYPEDFKKVKIDFPNPLLGHFNEENMQASILALEKLGLKDEIIAQSLSAAKEPPGRFENINLGQKFLVIVDYAHTPDGLQKILEVGQKMAQERNGKLITIFGCGGDRDRTKRPIMGKIAAEYSSFFVITADNPRSEAQSQITKDILQGIPQEKTNYQILEDRLEAINKAISLAKDKDVVILAGKGHETYQILNTGSVHFDDREEARIAIKKKLSVNN